ncbi:carbohydrate-binding module family 50 protein [Cylindrobasidium torrendii FP15055 ss-10]|uniref:Carbohydrate-binding module family 50 protein n=1 Tax=Cylindrobasidium torrendii FP15055 ss-10 TaxID=1314674 RepID=A0A0D7B8Q8_9AGAR|nr:carbohydrate-binding module family 50 protein [Cylindrobasidium torrendii FP15055 ss-10]
MGRWTQYDEDEYRLPEGMKRVGYDSDTQTYFFRDADGSTWRGASGAEFSEMTKVSDGGSAARSGADDDVEAAPVRRADGYQSLATSDGPMAAGTPVNPNAFRTLFPFFMIIGVVLLLVWRLVVSPSFYSQRDECPAEGTFPYWARPGDSCWAIATEHGTTLEVLQKLNPKVNCERLMPGKTVCLPKQE